MKIIVIGINHAGTSALRTLLKQSKEHEVLAIDRSNNISFLGCGIALTVSSKVSNIDDLFYSNVEEIKSMGATVLMKHSVIAINEIDKVITIKDLNNNDNATNTFEEKYDKLIYAAGSTPKDNQLKNGNLENIQICKTYENAKNIIEKANDLNVNKVAIIGAGYIGVELAEAFALKNKKVYLIDIEERVASNYFDESFSYKLEDSLIDNKVKLLLDTSVVGFEVDKINEKIASHVVTSKGRFQADFIINVCGFKPNTSLLKNTLKIKNGAIIVDEHMKSSIDDIYVIGDAAATYNNASKKFENISLATNAVKGGIVAASNINGIDIKMKSTIGTNAIHIFNEHLTATGLSEKKCKQLGINYDIVDWVDNDKPEFMEGHQKVSIRLVYEKNNLRLLGAQIHSNSDKESHMESIFFLALAIQKNMTILDIATSDIFFLPHYNKPFNFILGAILKALNLTYVKENR